MARSEIADELVDAGFSGETALAAVSATKNVGDNGSLSKVDASYADLGL
jgi:hypothetical protein